MIAETLIPTISIDIIHSFLQSECKHVDTDTPLLKKVLFDRDGVVNILQTDKELLYKLDTESSMLEGIRPLLSRRSYALYNNYMIQQDILKTVPPGDKKLYKIYQFNATIGAVDIVDTCDIFTIDKYIPKDRLDRYIKKNSKFTFAVLNKDISKISKLINYVDLEKRFSFYKFALHVALATDVNNDITGLVFYISRYVQIHNKLKTSLGVPKDPPMLESGPYVVSVPIDGENMIVTKTFSGKDEVILSKSRLPELLDYISSDKHNWPDQNIPADQSLSDFIDCHY
jgi:hypothetical protein